MSADRLPERELLSRLRGGDFGALKTIYETYKDELLTLADTLVGDVSTAEDCVHDVFVAFAERACSLRINRTLKGYLATSVANRARDRLRRRSRRDLPLGAVTADERTHHGGDEGHERLVHDEDCDKLRSALRSLPHEQREVIALRTQADLTFKEIASLLRLPENTARSRYRYGLGRLRSLLNSGAST
jgi:RNA polymerase sigma-70 factor (ECF subfamily)